MPQNSNHPARRGITVNYNIILFYASLIFLFISLGGSVLRCIYIFPPYFQSSSIISDTKISSLDFFVLPTLLSAICVTITSIETKRLGRFSCALLVICALAVPTSAAAIRLGDAYYACNFVPPVIFFAFFSSVTVAVRGLLKPNSRLNIKSKPRKYISHICMIPFALVSVLIFFIGVSGHKLFASLAYLYLPLPYLATAVLAAIPIKSNRTAAAIMCCPLSICIFCALRPYGFDSAYWMSTTLTLAMPILAVSSAVKNYIDNKKNIAIQEKKSMPNNIISGLGFHHIALKASDFEKSYDFYTKGLGMTPLATWGEGEGRIQMLDIGDGTILELFAGGPKEAECTRWIHLAFKCDDVYAAFNTAIAAGARVKSEPKEVPLDSKPNKMTLCCAFVYGPDDEELEFFKVVG